LLLAGADGCAMMGVGFGKMPNTDWSSMAMSILFAGGAQALVAPAMG
jgi:hypothetical protein